MAQDDRTKAQLISEIDALKKRLSKLEPSDRDGSGNDLTDKEHLEKYKTLFDNAPLSYQSLDEDGCFLDINETWLKTLGYARDEVIGKWYGDFLHPDWAGHFAKNFPAFKKRGYVHDVQFRIKHKQGHFLDITFEGCIGYHPDGTFKQTYCVFKDISLQKQAERELLHSQDKLAALIKNIPGMVYRANPDWSVDIVTGAEEISGYSSDDLQTGKLTWLDIIHPDDKAEVTSGGSELQNTHMNSIQTYRVVTKQGDIRWVEDRKSSLFSEAGEFLGIDGVVLDVSGRMQTDEDLQESYSLLSSIIESPANIIMFALDRDYHYLSFNTAHIKEMKRIYDVDIEIGQLIFSYMSNKDDKLKAEENYKRVLGGERFIEIQEYGQGKNRFWYELVFNPIIDKASVVSGFTVFVQDITERKRAENDLLEFEKKILQTQKLESLGVLAGGIAHDFNNILMGILGYADLALSTMDPIAPAREYVKGINDSSHKAAGLIRQMLAYSGKGKFSLEPIDLNYLLKDTVQMLEISISKSAVLKHNYSSESLFIEGDPSQIRQIVMNLVINASDAVGKKSGVIALTTGSMYCDRKYIEATGFESQVTWEGQIPEGMYAFMEVSDTGEGMSGDTIARIFEPFFTTKFTGRGLGLSAVLGIVRGHQGIIKIYSEEGKGTTFKVLFPLIGDQMSNRPTGELDKNSVGDWQGQGLFLVADDEEAVRSVAKHMIRNLGFDVLTASDGREAVEVFKENADKIVGILLDLTMPHKDGARVFREVRNINPDVKVILTSGYNEQEATQEFVGKGLAGFIQKPFASADLLAKIKAVIVD